jgi:hypothetical protein
MWRRLRPAQLEEELIRVAPEPVLSGLERSDYRMAACTVVLGGVRVLGAVAASNMATGLAHSKVHPGVTELKAFLASVAARLDVSHLAEMPALLCHSFPPPVPELRRPIA